MNWLPECCVLICAVAISTAVPPECYQVGPRGSVAQDVVIKLMIRHGSMRCSKLNPEAISRECATIVRFREAVQQLHQRPGNVHREIVAGEKLDGWYLRKSRMAVASAKQVNSDLG